MKPEELRTLQLIELKALLEVKRICEKHNINYFIDGGTLLGAVRHHGFIPWDDDVDVGMLREDYIKFEEVCKTELNPEYFFQTYSSDKGYTYAYGKLRVEDTNLKYP